MNTCPENFNKRSDKSEYIKNDSPAIKISKEGKEVLKIETNGRIIWWLNGEEIIVEDKQLLALAFLDVVITLAKHNYDYSLLDPDLYQKYQEFLKSRTK